VSDLSVLVSSGMTASVASMLAIATTHAMRAAASCSRAIRAFS
jgi:hypothetical protein